MQGVPTSFVLFSKSVSKMFKLGHPVHLVTNQEVQLKLKLCRMERKQVFFSTLLLRRRTEDLENKSPQVTKCLSALCLHNCCKIARPCDMLSNMHCTAAATKHFRKTEFFFWQIPFFPKYAKYLRVGGLAQQRKSMGNSKYLRKLLFVRILK